MKRIVSLRFFVLACVLAAAACGCSQKATLNPVAGKVLYQGKPLAGALVSFHAEDPKSSPATGFTKDDGTFSVMTGDIEGAKSGEYRITIMCQAPLKTATGGMSFGPSYETEDRLKGAYANRDASQIKVTIKDGPNQLEPFDLK